MYPLSIHSMYDQFFLPKPREFLQVMQLCVQPSCTSMAKTKRVTKGVTKESTLRYKKNTSQKYALQQKYPSKNNAATPSPGLFSPRPRVHLFIVVLLRLSTGRCSRIRPPGCKLRPISYPPPVQKFDKNPILKTKSPRHPPAVPAPAPACAR